MSEHEKMMQGLCDQLTRQVERMPAAPTRLERLVCAIAPMMIGAPDPRDIVKYAASLDLEIGLRESAAQQFARFPEFGPRRVSLTREQFRKGLLAALQNLSGELASPFLYATPEEVTNWVDSDLERQFNE